MAPKTEKGDLTEKEKTILGLAWKCFVGGEPKMDWEKLAALGGYKNPRSAQNILIAAKKKLNEMSDGEAAVGSTNSDATAGDDAATATPVATPTPAKKKKAAATKGKGKRKSDEDEDEDDVPETPIPKRAKKAAPKSAVKKVVPLVEAKDEDDDDTEREIIVKDEVVVA